MRATVAPIRVDTVPAQLICRANNFANASGYLVTQPVVQRTGRRPLHRAFDAGRLMQHNCQRLHYNSWRCLASASGGSAEDDDDDESNVGADGEAGPSSYVWDLPSRHQRMQAAAAKVGDPLRDMVSIASKKLQCYLENHPHVKTNEEADNELEQESDWARWQKVFAQVETNESLSTMLTFQIDEAVEKEDFEEAARLKDALDAVTEKDVVAEITSELKKALAEERYDDAAILRDKAGAGLIGWWVGLAEGGNDPYGRIVHIHAAEGRLVAKGYSARQLATAAPGVPLFEIFVTKKGERYYEHQAVYLQRDRIVATEPPFGSAKDVGASVENSARDEDHTGATKELFEDTSENGEGKARDATSLDESFRKIMSFLAEVIAPEGVEVEIPKIIEQLMEQEEFRSSTQQDLPGASTSSSNNSTAEKKGLGSKFPLHGKIPVGGIGGVEEEDPIRLVVGEVLQNSIDSEPPKLPVRVPARIEHQGRNAFTFHIEDPGNKTISTGAVLSKELTPSPKVAIIATQASADLMPNDVLWISEKGSLTVSKEMGEIIRLGSSLAQRRRSLFSSTSFRRINVPESNTDPLCGLYIGAFGPYTSEVVQLQRKYGHWESDEASSSGQNLEFFEYVEAVKLTGDLNVPAGQVTFRARIGRESRLSHRGAYPEELGVVTRYKGQGRLAEPGFRNPQWIDGELVLLDGKGGGYTNGAALGFVYSVPERHFLVLFKRLNLDLTFCDSQ